MKLTILVLFYLGLSYDITLACLSRAKNTNNDAEPVAMYDKKIDFGLVGYISVLPNGDIVSTSLDNTIKLWNSTTGTLKKSVQYQNLEDFRALSSFPNGDIIAGLHKSGFFIFDSNLNIKSNHSNFLYVSAFLVFSNGNFAVAWFNKITIFDGSNNNIIKEIPFFATIQAFEELQNGDFASSDFGSKISIWHSNGILKMNLTGHSTSVNALTKLPNGDLVSGSYDNTIKVWDVNTGLVKKTLTGSLKGIIALKALSNDFLVSASCDEPLKIWNINAGLVNKTLTGPTGCVSSLVFLPSGKLVSNGYSIYIWSV